MRNYNTNIARFIGDEKDKEIKQLKRYLVGATALVAVSGVVAGYSYGELKELKDLVAVQELQLEGKDGIIKDLNNKLNNVIEERDCLVDDNNCLVEFNSEYAKRVKILEEEAKEASRLEKEAEKQAEEKKYIAEFDAELTAYYPEDSLMQGGFKTATGHDLEPLYYEGRRIIAMDKQVPLYSLVDIVDEFGNTYECIVLDRGGRIKGDKIDIVHKDRESAYNFGVQIGKAKIIRLGKGE